MESEMEASRPKKLPNSPERKANKVPKTNSTPSPLKFKSTVTSRMREHEGKLIRQLDQKDQEILELRSRMKSLTDKMSADRQRKMLDPPMKNRTRRLPAMPATNPDKIRLERMLKTLYSEKMGVERQLQVAQKSIEKLKKEHKEAESKPQNVISSRKTLQNGTASDPRSNLGQIKNSNVVAVEMMSTIKYKSKLCERLEGQLIKAEERAIKLKAENSKLEKQLQESSGQCSKLRADLYKVQDSETHAAILEKVSSLENILEEMALTKKDQNRSSSFQPQLPFLAVTPATPDHPDESYLPSFPESGFASQNGAGSSSTGSSSNASTSNKPEVRATSARTRNEYMIQTNEGYTVVESDICSSELSDIIEVPEEDLDEVHDVHVVAGPQPDQLVVVGDEDEPESFSSALSHQDVRYFMALYDHDVKDKGRNFLGFTAGQLITVLQEDPISGFYYAESGGCRGYVPCNLLAEVQTNSRLKSQTTSSTSRTDSKRALFDYDPARQSPNSDSNLELSFLTGDTIQVYGDMDEDGFFYGELNGRRGLVPSNYVICLPDSKSKPKYI